MGVFTFVCRSAKGGWSAKQLNGELEGSASSTYDLQRTLVASVLATDSSGGVQSSFSFITPSSAVFQVIVGGGVCGALVGGGGASAGAAAGGAPAAEAPPAEAKEEEKDGSDDEDMGFSLFE